MSKRRRHLSEDEEHLWRRATTDVKRRQTAKSALRVEKPLSHHALILKKSKAPESETISAPTKAKSPPADRGGEKRIRRGKLEIGATLDLHGHTQESGRTALGRFLRAARRRGERTVVVVTGVGRLGGGILRRSLPDWLAEPAVRDLISGFAQAHRTHGGQGAYYVFLKRGVE